MQEHEPTSAEARSTTPSASTMVDVLLYSLAKRQGTAIWFKPIEDENHCNAHRISIERHRSELASLVLLGGLGDAVLARLALLADLDLLAPGIQNGRLAVRVGETALELLVTLRLSNGGLSGELRVLNSLGQDLDTPITEQPGGNDFPMSLEPGMSVGPYRIEAKLGRGGIGTVYLVEHALLRKKFAMKVLHQRVLASDPDAAKRFVREARAAARVQHDGIIDVSDFGSFADGRHYLIMQLLDGRSLHELMATDGAVEPLRALRLMRDAASALGAAHAAGIVHRDVSPSNIFVESVEGIEKVKIVDFGAASVPDVDLKGVPDAPPGIIIGTPYYMAPEQAQGLPSDSRTDMYSFGVVLYELVSGRVPFNGDNAIEIVTKHIRNPVPALFSEKNHEVPEPVWLLIERLMAKKPEDRHPTTDAVIADLDRVIALLQRKGWRKWLPA